MYSEMWSPGAILGSASHHGMILRHFRSVLPLCGGVVRKKSIGPAEYSEKKPLLVIFKSAE